MIRVVATFDVPYYEHEVDSYQARQVTAQIQSWEGVEGVHFLKAAEGKPRFALEITCTDEAARSVSSEAKKMMDQYSAYISDLAIRTYRQLA